jgi:hypothetical protein
MKKTLSIKLPSELESQLRETAAESGETTSSIVREALAEYFSRAPRPKKGGALDLLGDLVGSLEGPRDLATNRKHMKGFGE